MRSTTVLAFLMGALGFLTLTTNSARGANLQQKLNLVNFTQAASSCRKGWTPKNIGVPYAPQQVSWKSVISACRAMGNLEKRYFNFWIRACFHDGMAAARDLCLTNPRSKLCTGLDASAILVPSEFGRPEDNYEDFMQRAGKVTVAIASYYDASAADTLAICGMVAVEELSLGKIKIFGQYPVRVGRRDNDATGQGYSVIAPTGQLPPGNIASSEFKAWFGTRTFGVKLAMALLGTHALIDHQRCYTGNGQDNCTATVATQGCPQSRMFKLQNHYFKDITSPKLRVVVNPLYPNQSNPDVLARVNDPLPNEFPSALVFQGISTATDNLCKFSSHDFAFPKDQPSPPPGPHDVVWACPDSGCDPTRPNAFLLGWPYVQCDAYFGQSYIGHYVDRRYLKEGPGVPVALTDLDVGTAVKLFLEDEGTWLRHLAFAFVKMVHLWATYTPCGKAATQYTDLLRTTTDYDPTLEGQLKNWKPRRGDDKEGKWPSCIISGEECNMQYLDSDGLSRLGIFQPRCRKMSRGRKDDVDDAQRQCKDCSRRDGDGNRMACSPCCQCMTLVENNAAINDCMIDVAKGIAAPAQLDPQV